MNITQFFSSHRGLPFRSMTVFNYLLEAALAGAILILLLLAVRQVFRKKLGNRLIYMAWLLVAMRLLIPVALPNPLMNQFRPTYSTDVAARPVADQVRVRFQDALSDLSWSLQEREYSQAAPAGMDWMTYSTSRSANLADDLQEFAAVTSYGWTGKWFLITYGAVAGGVAVWMIASNARFRRRMRKGRVATLNEEEQALYLAICQERGVKRPLPVWRVDPLAGACLVGVVRPYIALPLTMKKEELPFALAHEICHHKAHDEWWSLLRLICCAVQWFNPLVWLGAKASRTDCELACDDRVTARMDEEQRRTYAQVLLATAAKRSRPGVAVLATGMTMNGKRLKKRLMAIVQSKAVRRSAAITFAALACMTTVLAFCTAESSNGGLAQYNTMYDVDAVPNVQDSGLWMGMDSDRPGEVTNEEEALAAARWYMNALMNHAVLDYDSSVRHAPEGWYVAFSQWDRNIMALALVDDGGRLRLYQQSILPRQTAEPATSLPDGMDDAMAEYVRRIAENILGAEMDGDVHLAVDEVDDAGRYLTYEASVGGETCRFTFRVDGQALVAFSTPVEPSVATQADALTAMWRTLESELGLQRQTHDTYTEVFFYMDYLAADNAWQVTATFSRKDQTAEVQDVLEQRYGRHACYVLQATVDGDSGAISALERLPEQLTENVPEDAKTGITAVYTETYAMLGDHQLRREETLPVGVPYTIIRALDTGNGDVAFDSFERWLLIRYVSPEGGDEIERWITDPELLRERIDVDPNPALTGDAWRTLTYTDGAGTAYTLSMLDKTDNADDSPATATDAAISLEAAFALAVEAVEAEYGVPPEALLTYRGTYRYVTDAQDFFLPYWQFDIYMNEYDFYEIILSAESGTLYYLASPLEGNG